MDGREWVRYQRATDGAVEAMYAHLVRHAYHVHSHDAYSFGLTEFGAQDFRCRGERRRSSAGMVMVFNPDDPHDGHAADEAGFTYRIVHIEPAAVSDVLAQTTGRGAFPLFTNPVIQDRRLFAALHALHQTLMAPKESGLGVDEALVATIQAITRTLAHTSLPSQPVTDSARLAARTADLLHDRWNEPVRPTDLAEALGRSRYAIYRAFRLAYGMAPSDYQRQLRLRAARNLLRMGTPVGEAAFSCGFADQSHLTRWFSRYYGLSPAIFAGGLSLT